MTKKTWIAFFLLIVIGVFFLFIKPYKKPDMQSGKMTNMITAPASSPVLNPLSIQAMRQGDYPGSNVTIEQDLPDGINYKQYIASYQSDGLKIYALLTIPLGEKPQKGWPVIVFNHGYIPPAQYKTTERYVVYVETFAKNGYVVFKPDYRGNGSSQGQPEGAYYSPSYTVDDLNAISSIKKYPDVNPDKVGVWGHSMGGNITLRDLVVRPTWINAAVIWGGVVGSYLDLEHWHDPAYHPSAEELALRFKHRSDIETEYGTPEQNLTFWNTLDPTNFISDITAPVQLDVGLNDEEVPTFFSTSLKDKLEKFGKSVEYFEYPGADHNISQSLSQALQNSLDFFNRYLKDS